MFLQNKSFNQLFENTLIKFKWSVYTAHCTITVSSMFIDLLKSINLVFLTKLRSCLKVYITDDKRSVILCWKKIYEVKLRRIF